MRKWKMKQVAGGMPRRTDDDYSFPLQERTRSLTDAPALPLVHVTNSWGAKGIAKKRKFETKFCDIFGVDLAYFFVLRPAYLSKLGSDKTQFLDYAPAAFILKPEAVPQPYHVYPFDTGAGARGAYKEKAHKFVPLEAYALEESHQAAAKFVQWAFGTAAAYFRAELRSDLDSEIGPEESVAQGYLAVARIGVEKSRSHDTRSSTIELASSQNVDIADNIRLLIVPDKLLEGADPFCASVETLRQRGTVVRNYNWRPNTSPNQYQDDLMRIARDWYLREKIIA